MGQITKDFAERMIVVCSQDKHPSLTVHEAGQLAYAWLEREFLRDQLTTLTAKLEAAEKDAAAAIENQGSLVLKTMLEVYDIMNNPSRFRSALAAAVAKRSNIDATLAQNGKE